MISCGRIRKTLQPGINELVAGELEHLRVSALSLGAGETSEMMSPNRETALVIIHGECTVSWPDGEFVLGPRKNPFDDLPSAVLVPRETPVRIESRSACLIGIGSAPSTKRLKVSTISKDQVRVVTRGTGNWERTVRMVCWSDNSEGETLLAGETCTPSGNWSTIPPHRHQFLDEGNEVPYEEAYLFQFSRPQGFGIIWQFDDDGAMDQAFSLRNNDVAYVGGGYHPVVCGPGSTLYHLSLMAGPRRISLARVHPDYRYLLEDQNMHNQFTPEGR